VFSHFLFASKGVTSMATNDIWQVQSVVKIDGQNGSVVQHFRVDGGDTGLSESVIAADLADEFDDVATSWAALAPSDATFVGTIIQKVWPARGLQFGFVLNRPGDLLDTSLPCSNVIQMVKRPAAKGRVGVGFMSWSGIGKARSAQGRLVATELGPWTAFGNIFTGIFNPTGGSTVDWQAGVWSRTLSQFISTYRVDTKADIGKIANRSPVQALG
jgi:hypothetical protein